MLEVFVMALIDGLIEGFAVGLLVGFGLWRVR